MALRANWEPKFLIELQATSISTAGTFTTGAVGPVVSQCLLEAVGEPALNSGFNTIFTEKATGQPTDFKGTTGAGEIQVGISRPDSNFETDYNANLAALYLRLLFQQGVSEAVGAPFVKTFSKTGYAAAANIWASLLELLSKTTAGENRIINGAILRSLQVAGNSNDQVIRATPEFAGASFAATFDASSVDADVSPDIDSLLFKNMVAHIDGNAVNLDSFNFTITSNPNSKPYNNASPQKHILGRLRATGQIVVPKDSGEATLDDNAMLNKFTANTDFTLALFWGANPAASNGDVAHVFNCNATDVQEVRVDGELANQIDWQSVDDGSNDLSATCADNIDRGW